MDAERMQVQWISAIWVFCCQQGHPEIPQAKGIQSASSPPISLLMYFSLPLKPAVSNKSFCYQQPFRSCIAPINHPTENAPVGNSITSIHTHLNDDCISCMPDFPQHKVLCRALPFSQKLCLSPLFFQPAGLTEWSFPQRRSCSLWWWVPPLTQENKSEILSFSHSAKIKSNQIKAKKPQTNTNKKTTTTTGV